MKENPQLNSYLRSAAWNENEADKLILSDIRKILYAINGKSVQFPEIAKNIFDFGVFFNSRVEDCVYDYTHFKAKVIILAGLKLCRTANNNNYDIITLWLDKEGNSYEKNIESYHLNRTLKDIYRFLMHLHKEDWEEDIELDKTSSGLVFYLKNAVNSK